jgi:CBS domain containing-hemolysin-like protein
MTGGGILLFCVALILLNGLFVAAEFAMIGAPKTAIEHRAGKGDRVARRLMDVLKSPGQQDQYIATSQLGITVASLALGMYGEPLVANLIHPYLVRLPFGAITLSGVLALAVLTLGHIVIGEIAPKSLALQHAERIARIAYWPMRVTLLVFYPFVWSLNGIGNLGLRLIGIRRTENVHEQSYTPEELQLIVEESEQGGAIRAESGRLVRELFEFGDLTAGQVMMPRVRVLGIRAGARPDEVRALVASRRHARYPVFEGDLDHILGVVHARDVLRRLLANEPVTASDATSMPVVPETAALDDVLATLQRTNAHVAVVVDEHGGTAGLVSIEDLFEEVVGDIDEGGTETSSLVPLADGSVRAPGTLRLDELGQHFDLPIEHEQVDSISGLVLALLGRPPLIGEVVEYGRLRVEVLNLSGLGVREVRVWLVD